MYSAFHLTTNAKTVPNVLFDILDLIKVPNDTYTASQSASHKKWSLFTAPRLLTTIMRMSTGSDTCTAGDQN